MKYNLQVTSVLLSFFLLSQLAGLSIYSLSIKGTAVGPSGQVVVEHIDAAIERPQTEGLDSLLFILLGVGIATAVLLAIIRFNLLRLWRLWFFLAIWLSVTVSLAVLVGSIPAAGIAFLLGAAKLHRPNLLLHNLTEILMYAGIAVLFAPVFDLLWATVLLLAISAYDAVSVWHTGHMVTMAKFLSKSRVFAGLAIPLRAEKGRQKVAMAFSQPGSKGKAGGGAAPMGMAILGGGDMAFPLIFSAVAMDDFIKHSFTLPAAFLATLAITACVTLALFGLLAYAKKGKFYPAMPFLTVGCLAGFGLARLLLGFWV